MAKRSGHVRSCGWFALLLSTVATAGCAGSGKGETTTPTKREVEFEELRINARAKQGGGYEFESYDASDLFKKAVAFSNEKKCDEAVVGYDRVVAEFEASQYVSAALYNGGLCLQALGKFPEAAEHYEKLRKLRPQSEDVKDGSFLLAEVLIQLERFQDALTLSDELLAREDISADERLEGMARRSQALLGLGKIDDAQRYAQSALSYFRTRPKEQPIRDEFYAAACNYVLAETYRMHEQTLLFPEGLEPQKAVLIQRAQLLLQAQREYFNTISFQNLDNLHWAAASGYRIGNMYDELWHAVMAAPVPANLKGGEGEAVYHQELAKLIKPLIRHAIRYWEMTQLFIERTGMKTQWSEKTKVDLARVRALLLEQPEGEGGLPPAAAGAATPSSGAGAPAQAAKPNAAEAKPAAPKRRVIAAPAQPTEPPPVEPTGRNRNTVKVTE
jgi:tetratricopeptide (TPR) repeat protein